MTPIAVAVVDALGLMIVFWILNLVRRGRLYIGYAVFGLLTTGAGMVAVSYPHLPPWLGLQLGFLGFVCLGFAVSGLTLVYVLSQLSILSNRLATLVQELAIERGRHEASRNEPKRDD